ncbi:MAG: copper chaperone PCu(A)C [Lentilitoribacter sp.]
MSNSRKISIIAMLILGALALFWSLNSVTSSILVSNVKAVKMSNSMYSVYFNMQNDGEPDFITEIQATDQNNASVMGAHPTFGVAIPQGSSPSFSSDGAHIMLMLGANTYKTGEFIPLTIVFKNSNPQQIKAIIQDPNASSDNMSMGGDGDAMDHSKMDHSMHQMGAAIELNSDQNPPSIDMSVSQNTDETWSIELTTQNFEFYEPETEPLEHKDGQGHGHLYLNGLKLQRMYSNTTTIGQLPKGQHMISVTLNSNDHRAFSVEGAPVTASAEIIAD